MEKREGMNDGRGVEEVREEGLDFRASFGETDSRKQRITLRRGQTYATARQVTVQLTCGQRLAKKARDSGIHLEAIHKLDCEHLCCVFMVQIKTSCDSRVHSGTLPTYTCSFL